MNLSLKFREHLVGDLWAVGEEFDQLLAELNARIPVSPTTGGFTFNGQGVDLTVHNLKFLTGGQMSGELVSNGTLRWLRGPWLLDDVNEQSDIAVLRPPDPSGTINDYEPPGLSTAIGVDIEPSAALTLTGLKATHGKQKRLLMLRNRDSSNSITLKDQNAGSAALNRFDFTNVAPGSAGGASAVHSLLDGSVHGDTVADAVTRGSLIYGNSTPKWDELVVGAANTVLRTDGTDAAWGKVNLTTDVSGVLPGANGGTILTASGNLTELQLESLASSPVTIVSAAGSNTVIVPVGLIVQTVITAGYGSAPSYELHHTGNTTDLTVAVSSGLNGTGTKYAAADRNGSYVFTAATFDPTNKDLVIAFGSNPTDTAGGAATAKYRVAYYIVDYS